MRIDLSRNTALVMGSTSGIGHAIAKGLAPAGAAFVINGRTQSQNCAGNQGRGHRRQCPPRWRVATRWYTALPTVDILINNAGIFGIVTSRL
jgi:NAD(P)-dependent dehydrogenase (short-subunit alcohol dehydrogenase family)